MPRRVLVGLLVTLAACGSGGGSSGGNSSVPNASTTAVAGAAMQLASPAFADGAAIPAQFTCDGANQSPPLTWTGVPPGTAGFALRVQDIDTPAPFTHWLAYNIDPATRSLDAGQAPPGATQVPNSFTKPGYGGPCPPRGSLHRYVFTLLALRTRVTISDAQPTPVAAWSTLERSGVVGRGELTGTYRRPTS